MSLHIGRFLDKIKAAEGRRQRDITLTVKEAHDLHTEITKLLLLVQDLRDNATTDASSTAVQLEVDGGSW
jgi:hypothetical protein